jgi:hypothetical protein
LGQCFPGAAAVGVDQLEVGRVQSDCLVGLVFFLDQLEFLEVVSVDYELVIEDGSGVVGVGLLAGAEVLPAWDDGAVVLEELDESSDEHFLRIFVKVGFLADGQLNVEVGLSLRLVGIGHRFLSIHLIIVDHEDVFFQLCSHCDKYVSGVNSNKYELTNHFIKSAKYSNSIHTYRIIF